MAVEVDCARFKLIEAVGVGHLDAEALLESYVFDFAHEILTQVGVVDNLIVVERVKSQIGD